jgi:hypothetical protein
MAGLRVIQRVSRPFPGGTLRGLAYSPFCLRLRDQIMV